MRIRGAGFSLQRALARWCEVTRVRRAKARRRLKPAPLLLLAVLLTGVLAADPALPPELEGVGVEEKLGQHINLDLAFIGEDGYAVALRKFFSQGRPVIL